jgi:predicted AAA+ superfamily ATPase
MDPIFNRSVVEEIDKYIDTDEVIVLHGARQVGKTSILYQYNAEDYGRKPVGESVPAAGGKS